MGVPDGIPIFLPARISCNPRIFMNSRMGLRVNYPDCCNHRGSSAMTGNTEHYPISLEQEVIWGDMDAFGHVNNTVYFRYFEDARMAFFECCGANEHKAKTRIGPILASTQCDFRAPLSYPDHIRIVTWAEEFRPRRFSMRYRVFSVSQSRLVAEGSGLVVFYDYAQGQSCEIPADIVERIQHLHAGFNPPQ
jgi:acyl-CoA thioester hydrolase